MVDGIAHLGTLGQPTKSVEKFEMNVGPCNCILHACAYERLASYHRWTWWPCGLAVPNTTCSGRVLQDVCWFCIWHLQKCCYCDRAGQGTTPECPCTLCKGPHLTLPCEVASIWWTDGCLHHCMMQSPAVALFLSAIRWRSPCMAPLLQGFWEGGEPASQPIFEWTYDLISLVGIVALNNVLWCCLVLSYGVADAYAHRMAYGWRQMEVQLSGPASKWCSS